MRVLEIYSGVCGEIGDINSCTTLFSSQGLPEARGTVPCHPHHPAQRAELPEAA